MDALDALSTERPVLSTRLWRSSRATDAAAPDTLDRARKLVAQLPVLVRGGWAPAVSLTTADAALRLEAAVWELAYRRDVTVEPGSTATQVARALAARGALAPPAAEAVVLVERVLADDGVVDHVELCRVAARLTAYVELRARFG
ncbi:MAG TPA: hypothetical protein VHF47_13610 [Acidimicrobiales bacterium]|nr:hypothetical protein [Acidimicrobiales bacterium]